MTRQKKDEADNVPAQSRSIPGATADNPNEDGQQSNIQPGTGSGDTGGGGTGDGSTPAPTPGSPSTPSDGGNPAANQGGDNGPA